MLPENVRQLFLAWRAIPASTCKCSSHVNGRGEPLAEMLVCEREKRWRKYCDARDKAAMRVFGKKPKISLNDIFYEDDFG